MYPRILLNLLIILSLLVSLTVLALPSPNVPTIDKSVHVFTQDDQDTPAMLPPLIPPPLSQISPVTGGSPAKRDAVWPFLDNPFHVVHQGDQDSAGKPLDPSPRHPPAHITPLEFKGDCKPTTEKGCVLGTIVDTEGLGRAWLWTSFCSLLASSIPLRVFF